MNSIPAPGGEAARPAAKSMQISVHFHSYFKELAGCDQTTVPMPDGCILDDLLREVLARCPRIAPLRKSMLVAVGVNYESRGYRLKAGDEVSIFPPVQGG